MRLTSERLIKTPDIMSQYSQWITLEQKIKRNQLNKMGSLTRFMI